MIGVPDISPEDRVMTLLKITRLQILFKNNKKGWTMHGRIIHKAHKKHKVPIIHQMYIQYSLYTQP